MMRTESRPLVIAETAATIVNHEIEEERRKKIRNGALMVASIAGLAVLVWVILKHSIVQFKWGSGLIQIGAASPLHEQPDTFIRIGKGSPTPVHFEGSNENKPFWTFSTKNRATALGHRRAQITRRGIIESHGAVTSTGPSVHVPQSAGTPAAVGTAATGTTAAAAATASAAAGTNTTASSPGACESYAYDFLAYQKGVLMGTTTPSAAASDALKSKLDACLKWTKQ